jgi:hypothetical protein
MCIVFALFQNVGYFDFSKFADFTMHLDIYYIYVYIANINDIHFGTEGVYIYTL